MPKPDEGSPSDQLRDAVSELMSTVAGRAASSINHRLTAMTTRTGKGGPVAAAASKLAGGRSPASAMVSAAVTGLKDKVGKAFGGRGDVKPKVTNIVESIDVGVPVALAYAQWTRFTEFPRYMKKVENVEQVSQEKLRWRAQILWSHRSWESTIQEQVPNERIIWRSEGEKGHVDGAVTFHEIAPNLTRVVLVLEYHPKGLFEHTGNIWRAQGRRVRLELKHFQRHAMTNSLLHPDDVEGWPGEIRDGEVVDDGSGRDKDTDADTDDDEPEERPRRRRTAAASRSPRTRTARTGTARTRTRK